MMGKFSRVLITSLIALSIFAPSVSALVPQTERFYVNDAADILSEETEDYIFEHSVALAKATTAQIVVVTVPNLEGRPLEEYATALFREYGIGDKEKNNGLLMLLALEERQSRIEVGYGLEGILPDGKTGRFQDDYMIPYFKENKFDEGMLNGYKAFYQEVAKEYNYDADVAPTVVKRENDEEESFDGLSGASVIGMIGAAIGGSIGLFIKKKKWIIFLILDLGILFDW